MKELKELKRPNKDEEECVKTFFIKKKKESQTNTIKVKPHSYLR